MVGENGISHIEKVYRSYLCANNKKKKIRDKKEFKNTGIGNLIICYLMKAIINDEVMGRMMDMLMELKT